MTNYRSITSWDADVANALLRSLMAFGSGHGSDLQLDQWLQDMAHQLGDQVAGGAAIQ